MSSSIPPSGNPVSAPAVGLLSKGSRIFEGAVLRFLKSRGGRARPSWPAPHYLGEQYFVGGGKAPLAPPGSAHGDRVQL